MNDNITIVTNDSITIVNNNSKQRLTLDFSFFKSTASQIMSHSTTIVTARYEEPLLSVLFQDNN